LKFEVLGWKCVGLRCPDVDLSFQDGDTTYPVALLQMPNGTGKTTTLDLLRASMTGEARYWDKTTVKDLRRRGSENVKGHFQLRLAVDGEPLSFNLEIDLADGLVGYQTTSPSIGGIVEDWKPPAEARRFLRKEFVDLFIFNGELAKVLMDSEQSAAEDSIDALCQLDLLDTIEQKISDHWERETKKGGPKSRLGLKQARSSWAALKSKLKKQQKLQKKAQIRLEVVTAQIEKLEAQLDSSFKKSEDKQRELSEAKDNQTQLGLEMSALSRDLMANLRHPESVHSSIGAKLVQLKDHLDVLKLPESTSRQFFKELREEELCVCGRPLDEECRKAIDQHAAKYLGEEISGFLNSLKNDIEKFVGGEQKDGPKELNELERSLEKLADKWHGARTLSEKLEAELIAGGGKKLKTLAEKLGELSSEKQGLSDALEEMEDPNFAECDVNDLPESIPVLIKALDVAKSKIDEISGTVELGEKTAIISELVRRSKSLSRDSIRASILADCNDRLQEILANDPIEIEDIGRSISMRGQRAASEGQTLAVGYTFLTTVLDRGSHVFPLVVDSPAIPIDIKVRRQIGELIPALCHQFVGLTISSERAGFVPALHEAAKGNVKYLTLFRRTDGTSDLEQGVPKSSSVFTETSVVVEGKEYFQQFDVEEEV
jgi:DNA sulfur modification protein DndD